MLVVFLLRRPIIERTGIDHLHRLGMVDDLVVLARMSQCFGRRIRARPHAGHRPEEGGDGDQEPAVRGLEAHDCNVATIWSM